MVRLTEQEVIEKIAEWLHQQTYPLAKWKRLHPSGQRYYLTRAIPILAIIKEAGYLPPEKVVKITGSEVEELADKCQQRVERIIGDLEAIDRDAYDVKDFTRRVCDFIVAEKQALKKQEGVKDGQD